MYSSFLLIQLLSGLAYAMLLFLMAAGLTIIYGFMHVVNLAHGSFFVVGAYITFSLIKNDVGFWLAVLLSVVAVTILGILVERLLLTHVYGKGLEQVLLTFGLSFVIADLVKMIWGNNPQSINAPALLDFSFPIGGQVFPAFRLFVIAVGILVAFLLWYLETKTQTGAIIRAGVDDREVLGALGINVKLVFAGVFAFGAALAGLSGALAGPILGLSTTMELHVLVFSLTIVVIGGLGTWKGSFVGAILVGLIEKLGEIWFPAISMFLVFALMIVVLLVRPRGLFGKEADV